MGGVHAHASCCFLAMENAEETPRASITRPRGRFTARNRPRRRPSKRREHAMIEVQTLDVRIPAEIIHNWGWFLAFGIGLALLGILAIVRAVAATVVSMLFFGWLLVIAAGIEIVQAIMVGKWAGLFQHWLGAVLFGVIGIQIG